LTTPIVFASGDEPSKYGNRFRPILVRGKFTTNALWISRRTGGPLTRAKVGSLISRITLKTLGVDLSPHLFRTAAASTAAELGGDAPHLASALFNHTDSRVTDEHYNRASSIGATKRYAEIIGSLLGPESVADELDEGTTGISNRASVP
jgi:site-specific recombinase XerD